MWLRYACWWYPAGEYKNKIYLYYLKLTITFIYVSMNLIRIFAKKFEMRLWSSRLRHKKIDRTRGDGSDCSSGSWKHGFQWKLLIAFQLSWDCLEHIMDLWYDQKSYKTVSIGEVIMGVEIIHCKNPESCWRSPIGLLIIDNLKPKGTSPTAADGIATFHHCNLRHCNLPTNPCHFRRSLSNLFNKVIVGDQSGKPIESQPLRPQPS